MIKQAVALIALFVLTSDIANPTTYEDIAGPTSSRRIP